MDFRHFNIQSKLIAFFILILIVPLVYINIVWFSFLRDQAIATTKENLTLSAHSIANTITTQLYQQNIATQSHLLSDIGVREDGYAFIVNHDGAIVAHPDATMIGKKATISQDIRKIVTSVSQQKEPPPEVRHETRTTKNEFNKAVVMSFAPVQDNAFIVFTQVPVNEVLADSYQMIAFVSAMVVLCILVVFVLGYWIARQIVTPIKTLQQGSQYIGSGHLDYHLNIKSGDEIEDLGNAFNAMADDLQTAFTHVEAEKNKLSVALEGLTDAVIVVDLHRTIIIFNKAAEQITGYTKEEALNRSLHDIVHVYEDTKQLQVRTFCPINTEKDGIVFSKHALRLVGKAKESYVDMTAGHIKKGKAVNVGCILTLHDKTQETELEKTKLDFVSMTAHELRTPLTSIKGYLALFQEENKDKLQESQLQLLDRMKQATLQLSSIIESLLNVTRIEKGTLVFHPQAIDIPSLVQQRITEFLPRAQEKQQTLKLLPIENKIPPIEGDPVRIGEVVSNLITNAIHYTPAGGSIAVEIKLDTKEVIIAVTDNGNGIPEESIPHLFTKFYRVPGMLSQSYQGTGLGLYISKVIVEKHSGNIWVESEEGKGSTFYFSLPLHIANSFK